MTKIKAQYIGLITGGLMVAASFLFFHLMKKPVESNYQLVIYTILTAGIIWSLLSHFKKAAGKQTFKDFFGTGFKTFIVCTLLMALYTFVFFKYLNTSFRDEKIAENSQLLLKEGNHTPQEIEENAKKLAQIFMPLMISRAVFSYLIIGAIVTAIGSGFLSQKSKENV